ncbi:MAG: hypothetical protein ACKPCM_09335 [Pseudanabaena sp.]
MKILNLLAHAFTTDQAAELAEHEVVSLVEVAPDLAKFASQCPDDRELLKIKAAELADICDDFDKVIAPIGSPAFMAEFFAIASPVSKFIFAHSVRESVEIEVDGVVQKKVIFKHVRFF